MANPNPHQARQAKKQRGKPGDLSEVRAVLWRALLEAETVLEEASQDQPELKLKAVHAVSQTAGQYAKLLEIGELEARLQALEIQAGLRVAS